MNTQPCGTGATLQQWQRRMPPAATRSGLLNSLTLGVFKDFLAMSCLIASRRG